MGGVRLILMMMAAPVFCGISLARPFMGLCFLVFWYYFRPDYWGAPDWFRPQLWFTVSVGLGWLINLRKIRFPPLMVLATLVVALCYATAPFAEENTDTAKDASVTVLKLITVMLFTVNLVDTPERMNWFLWANVWGMAYNLKSIFWTGLHGGEIGGDRVDVAVGQGGGANYIAMILTMTLPFFLMKILYGNWRRWEPWLALVLAPLYVVAVVLTGSRAGFLSMGAVFLYVVLRSNRKLIGLLLMLILAGLFVATIPRESIERFNQGMGLEGERDKSASGRLRLWQAALTMFAENPLTGVGLDNYSALSPRYTGFFAGRSEIQYQAGMLGRGFVAHSTWLQMLAEGGLVVSVPFFFMFPVAFRTLRKVKRTPVPKALRKQMYEHALTLEAAFIAFIVSSIFGSHLKIDFMWWYFGAVAALLIIARGLMGDALARSRAPDWGEAASVRAVTRRAVGSVP